MSPLSPDEIRRMEEDAEIRRQIASEEETRRQMSNSPSPDETAVSTSQEQTSRRTPRQVAEVTEEVQGERGIVTETGEFLQQRLDPLNAVDNAVGDLNNNLQNLPLPDEVKNLSQGLTNVIQSLTPDRQDVQETIAERGGVVGRTFVGAGAGVDAAVATPFTVAGRLANQDTSAFSEPPAIVKDSVEGELAFEISRLATISLAGGGVAGRLGIGAVGARALESGAETLNQRSADDLVMGKELAIKLGEAADILGYDGEKLTEDLIEGKETNAQAIVAVAGFVQNFTFNTAGEKLFDAVGKLLGKAKSTYRLNTSRSSEVSFQKAEAEGRVLYHGTSKGRSRSIQKGGYRSGPEGDNLLGKGVYFTDSPGYASGYGDEVVGGIVPRDLNIIDATNKPFNEFLEEIGVGTPTDEFDGMKFLTNDQKKKLRQWSQQNNVDGIKFIPEFDVTGDEFTLSETIIFDPKKADQIIAPKAEITIDEKVAEVVGGSPEDVKNQIDDVYLPNPSKDLEPHEAVDVDSIVPVSKPTEGNTYISEPALVKEALERKGIASDGLDAADRNYFTSLRTITDNATYQSALNEATKGLKPLIDNVEDRNTLIFGADRWLNQFRDELNQGLDVDKALVEFPFEMVEPIDDAAFIRKALMSSDIPTYLRETAAVTPEGMIAGTILGEEMGVRLSQSARQIVNLDTAGVDFTEAVENYLRIEDSAQQILIPLRRGKRKWSLIGQVQQRRNLQSLRDADVTPLPDSVKKDIELNAPSRDFETIKVDETDEGSTIRELWESYQDGDLNAGNTLKTYFATVAYGDPKTAVSQIENLTGVLKEQLLKGNKDATRNLIYSYYLTRLSPISASLSSNIFNLVTKPVGSVLDGKFAYGMGEFIGGLSSISDAVQNAFRAYKTGQGLNQGSKLGDLSFDFARRNQILEQNWEGLRQQLIKDGKNWTSNEFLSSWLSYTRQKVANSPFMTAASRALLSTDQFSQTIHASQVATARAWKEAAETGVKRNSPEFKELIQKHYKKVFKDGLTTGKITDGEVLEASKNLTFQSEIPDDNWLDRGFKGFSEMASNNAMFNFISPFTRVTYQTMRQGGEMLLGSVPVAGRPILRNLAERYQKTLDGELGEVAQQELRSRLALAQTWSMGVAGLAAAGFSTGFNPPEGMPKTSFIVPANNKRGWIAIPYGKLEPIATPTALISDLVTGLRDEVIEKGDYERFFTELLYSLSLSTMDKSFMTGLTDSAALIDIKSYNENTLGSMVGRLLPLTNLAVPVGGVGGLTRMVGSWTNPYERINRVDSNPTENLFIALRNRIAGGHGNEIFYSPLDGQPELRLGHLGDRGEIDPQMKDAFNNGDYWRLVFASGFNELVVPGTVKEGKSPEVRKNLQMMDNVSYDLPDLKRQVRTYGSIALSAKQQSILSKDLHDFGQLNERLTVYFNSDKFKKLYRSYKQFRSDSAIGNTSGDTRSNDRLQEIHQDIRRVISQAKEQAVTKGRLSKDPEFVRKRIAVKSNVPLSMVPQGKQSKVQDLLIPTR